MKTKRKISGFTLVELAVAVTLVAILSTLAIYRYRGAMKRAKISEPALVLKKMWEMTYIYYVANSHPITSDGVPLFYGVSANDPSLNETNQRRLFQIGFDDKPMGDSRFYYVNTEGALIFAFPKSKEAPFDFGRDEIDGTLSDTELVIDNDGRIYVYEDGRVWAMD